VRKAEIKAAAVCLAGMAMEKRADPKPEASPTAKPSASFYDSIMKTLDPNNEGLWNRMAKNPGASALYGGLGGAALGGIGGGLHGWLSDDSRRFGPRRRKSRILNRALSGALMGGGLGAGAGVLPSLISGVQNQDAVDSELEKNAPKASKKPTTVEGLREDAARLVDGSSVAAGIGGGVATAGLTNLSNNRALRTAATVDISGLADDKARSILREVSEEAGLTGNKGTRQLHAPDAIDHMTGPQARSELHRLVREGSARKFMRNAALVDPAVAEALNLPRGGMLQTLKNTVLPQGVRAREIPLFRLLNLSQAHTRYNLGNRTASKVVNMAPGRLGRVLTKGKIGLGVLGGSLLYNLLRGGK
jgi:hypothetical protein